MPRFRLGRKPKIGHQHVLFVLCAVQFHGHRDVLPGASELGELRKLLSELGCPAGTGKANVTDWMLNLAVGHLQLHWVYAQGFWTHG